MINNKTKERKKQKKLTTGISLDERKHLQLYNNKKISLIIFVVFFFLLEVGKNNNMIIIIK